jgi:hypothetical protein
MKLSLDQPLHVSADQAQAAFADPAFYATLGALPNISVPEVLAHEADEGRVRLVLGYHFAGNLSGPARRVLSPDKISWSQRSEIDLGSRVTQVTMVPDNYKSLFSFTGWYRLDDDGPGRCLQHFEADLRAHIPLLGPLAERAIASGIRENLAATARLVEQFVTGAP